MNIYTSSTQKNNKFAKTRPPTAPLVDWVGGGDPRLVQKFMSDDAMESALLKERKKKRLFSLVWWQEGMTTLT